MTRIAKSKPSLTRESSRHPGDDDSDPGLLRVYASWANELKARYERVSDLFRHAPSIGRSRELYLAETLERALPAHLAVRHGAFYVPGLGASSEQDILVVDTRKWPPIEEIGDFGIYFRDSVVACIEVKSKLTRKELHSALRSMVTTKIVGPGLGSRYALFAYETPLAAQDILDSIENTVEFFDNRIYPIIVLGKFVITISNFNGKKPRPSFVLTAFQPSAELDLTLFELLEMLMEIGGESPFKGLRNEIRSHFAPVASRTFVCPEERPGTGLGTNRD
ncbi:DUF6602 domain-containing protein [Sorangium sp. So ce1097]|uniref:DUF6602 domain-containing protein n=1 Tax=Sorangium sp. So ce1097 TaxID=3133330 RepID=UPI003F6114FF